MLLGRIVQFFIHQRSKSDNKAFLLIRLKKYLNPHENSCSKVMSILITGSILHESSSAPQQHKSVQYKWFALYLHRYVSHTYMLPQHFISCRGVSGQEATCADPGICCQFYLILSLFYSLQRGSNGFIAEKTILILYQGSKGGPLFPGGCPTFSRGGGPNANFYRNPYTYLLFSRGGVPDPLSRSGSAHGQCHHNGAIFITVPLLTMIAGMLCQD